MGILERGYVYGADDVRREEDVCLRDGSSWVSCRGLVRRKRADISSLMPVGCDRSWLASESLSLVRTRVIEGGTWIDTHVRLLPSVSPDAAHSNTVVVFVHKFVHMNNSLLLPRSRCTCCCRFCSALITTRILSSRSSLGRSCC